MKHADYAWAALAAGIVTYEASCPRGELLSEAVDRYRVVHPLIINGAILYLALHLLRCWPRRIDPLAHLAAKFKK